MFSVAGRAALARIIARVEQVELVFRVRRVLRARQLLENRIELHLGIVDLRRQRVALRRKGVALLAQLGVFRAGRFRFRAQLRELLFEREPLRVMTLVQRDQTANILR
jgi:hypothetical protein